MAEYIEREATIELLRSLGSRDYRREKGTIQEAIKMVSFPEYTPSADVTPVRHGYWRPILHVGGKTDYECSCCLGIIAGVPDDDEHDLCAWCSMCGAKMDGGAEDASV